MSLNGDYASGAKVTVHAFQQYPSQGDTPFVVITTDSRFPDLYVKDVVTVYDEARARAFSLVSALQIMLVGAGALFSEKMLAHCCYIRRSKDGNPGAGSNGGWCCLRERGVQFRQ